MTTPTSWATTGPKANPIFTNVDLIKEGDALFFDKAYYQMEFPTGSGNKYAMPGLVLAKNTVTNKYVPWVADASHGAGSNTAVGILNRILELSTWDRTCVPVYGGEAIEQNVYTEAGAIGTVPAAVKTALTHMYWK